MGARTSRRRNGRRSTAHRQPAFDLATAPPVLTLPEYAALYRMGIGTVRKRLRLKTLKPWPFKTGPYRWRRADVMKDLGVRRQDVTDAEPPPTNGKKKSRSAQQ